MIKKWTKKEIYYLIKNKGKKDSNIESLAKTISTIKFRGYANVNESKIKQNKEVAII